jgi:hypothetical protein
VQEIKVVLTGVFHDLRSISLHPLRRVSIRRFDGYADDMQRRIAVFTRLCVPRRALQTPPPIPVEVRYRHRRRTVPTHRAMDVYRMAVAQKISERPGSFGQFCSQLFKIEIANGHPMQTDVELTVSSLQLHPVQIAVLDVTICLEVQHRSNAETVSKHLDVDCVLWARTDKQFAQNLPELQCHMAVVFASLRAQLLDARCEKPLGHFDLHRVVLQRRSARQGNGDSGGAEIRIKRLPLEEVLHCSFT